jgi:GNAT superfamily N-acetyltransferase
MNDAFSSIPAGQNASLVVRPAVLHDAPFIAEVHVKAWRESYQGIIEQSVLDNLSATDRLQGRLAFLSAPSKMGFVACLGDAIAGFCDVGPSRADRIISKIATGEIYAIYVLNAYKGFGVGYKLFSAAASFLHTQELCPFIAWALAENKPARSFYERQGGKICADGAYTYAGKTYPEICYRFNSSENDTLAPTQPFPDQ